jgi:hypothetical protein
MGLFCVKQIRNIKRLKPIAEIASAQYKQETELGEYLLHSDIDV